MYINWRQIRQVRLIVNWTFVCVLIHLLSACTKYVDNITYPDDEFAILHLTVKLPVATIPGATVRSQQMPEETAISNIKVLVFDDVQGTGDYIFRYMVDGTQLSDNRFQILLRSSTVPIRLYVIANPREAFNNYTPAVGDDEASVKSSVAIDFPAEGLTQLFPMYGEVDLSGIDPRTTNIIDVIVLRAIARVDVKKQLNTGSSPFDLREVHVYRANNRIQLIPDAVATDGRIRVTTSSVPSGSTPVSGALIKTAASATDSIGGIYLPESVGGTQQEDWQTTTTVVVGGVFGSDTNVSYYRVDFNSGVDGHPYGQVLRNYLYTFTIRRVTASGWLTAEDALVNQASSMIVEIQQWEDFTTDMYFHDNYIGVSTREVNVPFLPNYSRDIDVDASMNYEIQWVNAVDSGSVSQADVPLSDGYFTATIVRNASESANISHIRIESPQYNITDQPVQATLRLIANDTSVDIRVVKESPSQYSERRLRVLSVGDSYGGLGSFNGVSTFSQAMRNVLTTNFFPTSSYPFKIGGFFLISVPYNNTIYSAAVAPADVAGFKNFIENFDVVIMTYENYTSPQVTNMMLDEWLVENPHRVLWVMRDDAISNVNIVARTAQDGEGVWNNIGDAFSTTDGYRYSNSADYAHNNAQEVYEFFNGPFGTINNENTQLSLRPGDIVAGAALLSDTAKQYVTPLVYSNRANYTQYMSLGINKQRGIIYQGEAQFFQYNIGMGSTNGTIVTTPDTNGKYYFDVLNSNIWAWVTGRVIYGPI